MNESSVDEDVSPNPDLVIKYDVAPPEDEGEVVDKNSLF